MKRTLLFLSAMLFSLPSLADTFACQLEVNGKSTVEYEAQYRSRKVQVEAFGWLCHGKVAGDRIEIKMSEPSLGRDAEISQKSGPVFKELELKVSESVSCSCSLM